MRALARTVEDISLVAAVEGVCGNNDKSTSLLKKVFALDLIIRLG